MADLRTVDFVTTGLPDPDAYPGIEYRSLYQTLYTGMQTADEANGPVDSRSAQALRDVAAGILDRYEELIAMLRRDWLYVAS